MSRILLVVSILLGLSACIRASSCPECDMSLPELVRHWGYPCEIHQVLTADGFTLNMLRIPHGRAGPNPGEKRVPVMLQHGLIDSAAAYLINLPYESLGYILADQGYDVWLPNNRGNYMSPPPSECTMDDCWAFSFHEMGVFDMPANVEYVLNLTGYSSLTYIGHSEGATQAFVQFATSTGLHKKVNLFIGLGPVAFVSHETASAMTMLNDLHVLNIIKWFGICDLAPKSWLAKFLAEKLCANHDRTTWICESIMIAFVGSKSDYGYDNLNQTRIDVYNTFTPAGTSVQNLQHWSQIVDSGRFQAFDLGRDGNIAKYGQATAPDYDLSKVDVPMAMIAGQKDVIGDPTDFAHTISMLPQDQVVFQTSVIGFDHIDFTWGLNAHLICYPEILQLLEQYNRPSTSMNEFVDTH